MSCRRVRGAVAALVLAIALGAPASASAWKVTVDVHGAGKVAEVTDAKLMNCTVPMDGRSGSTVTQCVAGASGGGYGHGFIVELAASVPTAHYDRGWRFTKWVDSSASGRVNCDPQGTTGDHTNLNCRFQIWEDLRVALYFTDTHGPQDTDISSGPGTPTKSTSASFAFGSGDPDAGYECKLDRPGDPGAWSTCGTPTDKAESYTGLTANGQYTFAVRGKDPSGNVDTSPAVWTWTVDTVAPTVSISGTPAAGATTNSTSASLTAATNEGSLTCTFDGAASPCALTRSSLLDGTHTFTARATDAAGNVSPVSTRSWTVDTTGPVVTFSAGPGPGAPVNVADVAFEWTASEPAGFTCAMDTAAAEPCSSGAAYTGLDDGPHTLTLTATDDLGNETTVERAFVVDTAVPDTTLLSGPAEGSTTAARTATFEFASPDSSATFECRLDDAEFTACASPLAYNDLPLGDHVFEVRARDAAGNVDGTPARRVWRVNTLDADSDGINRPADCRDDDPSIHPGATDIPGDGIDQDCSGADATVPVDTDRDDDGASPPLDCNDDDAGIRPGATDTPQDGIDQDCSGADAAFPIVDASIRYRWAVSGKKTKVKTLKLTKLTADSRVRVTCKGKRCPIKRKTVKPRKGKVDVRKVLKRKPLRAGSVLKVMVTRKGHTAKIARFKFRRARTPSGGSFVCREPGARKTQRCP